jgi:transcriptional regulator with XRE-family HTH domain
VENSKHLHFLLQFGENLKQVRKSKGFTQAMLANDMGVEISQISRIERGVINTSVHTIYIISQILEVEVSVFFTIEN